jgi:hypothetical protein
MIRGEHVSLKVRQTTRRRDLHQDVQQVGAQPSPPVWRDREGELRTAIRQRHVASLTQKAVISVELCHQSASAGFVQMRFPLVEGSGRVVDRKEPVVQVVRRKAFIQPGQALCVGTHGSTDRQSPAAG